MALPPESLTSRRPPGRTEHVRARIIVLAASACESARLLLNSKSSRFPDGLANASGMVGRDLTDTTGTDVGELIPRLMDQVPHNEDGSEASTSTCHGGWTIESWTSLVGITSRSGAVAASRAMASWETSTSTRPAEGTVCSSSATIAATTARRSGWLMRGEMIPNRHSYCEIDPTKVDRWGIPVLRFHWKWSEHEIRQTRHAQQTLRDIIAEMGGQALDPMPDSTADFGLQAGGRIIHEVGGTRMGNDRRSSVLNRYAQAHDVKNLFVVDGGPFVGQGGQQN